MNPNQKEETNKEQNTFLHLKSLVITQTITTPQKKPTFVKILE